MQSLSEKKTNVFGRLLAYLYIHANPAVSAFIGGLFASAYQRRKSGSVIAGLVLFATAIIMVVVVAIVVYLFVNAATSTSGLTTSQKGNLTNYVNTGQSGLSLASIVPVIVIAAVIISVIGGFLVYRK